MDKPRSFTTRLRQKFSLRRLKRGLFHVRKGLYHRLAMSRQRDKTILFILGCQRSGTNMTQDIFTRDLRTRTYGEFSKLSSQDKRHKIRLNSPDEVKKAIQKDRPSLIVLKPIVESQNTADILAQFDNAKVLWVFRRYKDVASSNLKNFGVRNGINNLRPIVEQAEGNWRSEKVPAGVREIVLKYFSDQMNPHDAAALFWYVRNHFFFSQDLQSNPRVLMCKYEDLVTDPRRITEEIYDFLGQPQPDEKVFAATHPRSLGKGKDIDLSQPILDLCDEMWQRLDSVYQAQQRARQS